MGWDSAIKWIAKKTANAVGHGARVGEEDASAVQEGDRHTGNSGNAKAILQLGDKLESIACSAWQRNDPDAPKNWSGSGLSSWKGYTFGSERLGLACVTPQPVLKVRYGGHACAPTVSHLKPSFSFFAERAGEGRV